MGAYKENAAKRDAFFEEEKRQKMAAAAAEVSKVKEMKEPIFGEKGKEVPATEVARALFEGAHADLVVESKSADTITLQ
jgi:hypothetical protein